MQNGDIKGKPPRACGAPPLCPGRPTPGHYAPAQAAIGWPIPFRDVPGRRRS